MQNAFGAWIDDSILYAKKENKLLENSQQCFGDMQKIQFNIVSKKTRFHTQQAWWFQKLKDKNGYQLDPPSNKAIQSMDFRSTADELCQFIYCCQWMSVCIPPFYKTANSVFSLLESACNIARKQTKNVLKRGTLMKLSFSATHEAALKTSQKKLWKYY